MIEDDEPTAAEYSGDDLRKIGAQWMENIKASEKREKSWMDDAQAAETAYLCDEDADTPNAVPAFNILHSNVETIVPSIYNSTPVPDIRPRHNANDQLAKLVSDVYERVIAQQIDDGRLDPEVEACAQDAFLAGRGIVRVEFESDTATRPGEPQLFRDPETGEVYEEPGDPVEFEENERLIFTNVAWGDYREGPAKRWRDVPWVAYRHTISQREVDRIQIPEMVDLQRSPDDPDQSSDDLDIDIWEIWCRETERVYFVANDNCRVLKIETDPLGLSGFFPQPEPVQPITGTGRRTPVNPYRVYRKLAEELDATTRRINAIIKGLKVRGAMAGDASIAELLAQAGDNEIVPVPNIEGLVAQGGLEKAVMWWPIETAVAVVRELYLTREQTKQAIYEITGISDIIRGQGESNETATAQRIKTEWGSLRIKKMQRLIERQVRALFVISAEIISQKFSVPTLVQSSGIELPPEAQAMFNSPLDHYRIDVETDSTVRADLTRNRAEMSEFMRGTAEFFSTMAPLVAQSPGAAEPISEIFGAFSRQFSLGKGAEDALQKLVDMAKETAKNPPPNPEAEQAKAEMQMKAEELKARMQLEMQKLQLDVDGKRAELDLKRAELDIKRADLQLREAQGNVAAAQGMADLALREVEAETAREAAKESAVQA